MLFGAFSLFAATPAQAQTTVWSATLTADESEEFFGCDDNDSDQDNCSTALTDNDFTYGSATYTVAVLYWDSFEDQLVFAITKGGQSRSGSETKADLGSLTLNVDGTTLTISSAAGPSDADGIDWTYSPATDWTDGQQVSVSLTASASQAPPSNIQLAPEDQALLMSWDAPSYGVSGAAVRWRVKSPQGSWLPGSNGLDLTASQRNAGIASVPPLVCPECGAGDQLPEINPLTNGTTYEVQAKWTREDGGDTGWVSAGDGTPGALPQDAKDLVLRPADFLPISEGVDPYYELIVPANGSATFGVKLSAAPTSDVTVHLTKTSGGGLGSHHYDLNAATVSPKVLIFTPSNYNDFQTVTVAGVPGRANSHEHLVIVLAAPSGSGSAGAVKGILVTVIDDTAVKVGAWPCIGKETGDGSTRNADITVWLSKAATGQVTVDYATQDDSATEGSDYTAVSGTVTFAAGETRKTVQVSITDDNIPDSGEIFRFVLSNPQGASLDPLYTRASCEILNDEVHPVGGGVVQGGPPTNSGGTGTGGGGGGSTPPGTSSPDDGGSPPEEPSDTPCGEDDREDLISFYEATGGDAWDRNENWKSQEPLDEWFGVETDEYGNVISLRLADNGLSREIPEDLCLADLKELALWGNDDLSGEVPDELVLAVERAALRAIAEMLDLNPEWFEDYEDPFNFEDWHTGVTTDDDGRVTGLDLTAEGVIGEIPEILSEQLQKLRETMITTSSGGCALSPKEGSSAFSLFLLTLVVFAVVVRRRAR